MGSRLCNSWSKRKNTDRPPKEWDPEVKHPLGVDIFTEKNNFEMCFPLWTGHHLHCLRMRVTLNALLVGFQTKWLCWTMLLSQDKETRVQWPSLTPWRSCPRRLPAGYCWGSVRSAALCLAGGKQMDKSHTHKHVRIYSCITSFLLPLALRWPSTSTLTLTLNCLFQKLLGPCNGSTTSTNSHTHTYKHNY